MNQSLYLTKDRFASIILSYVILSKLKVNNRTCLQFWHVYIYFGTLYTFRSSNKQLNHRFLHFVVSLQSKFYTLAPTFVFDVNIYFSSSRLLTIDPSLSLLQAIHRQYLILALSLPLRWLSATHV